MTTVSRLMAKSNVKMKGCSASPTAACVDCLPVVASKCNRGLFSYRSKEHSGEFVSYLWDFSQGGHLPKCVKKQEVSNTAPPKQLPKSHGAEDPYSTAALISHSSDQTSALDAIIQPMSRAFTHPSHQQQRVLHLLRLHRRVQL